MLHAVLRAQLALLILSYATGPFAQGWAHRFGGSLGDQAKGIAATADGGWVVAGTVTPAVGDQDGVLVRLSHGGSIVWQRRYHEGSLDGFDGVAELTGGQLAVVGRNATTLLLDAAGTITWQRKNADSSGAYVARELAVAADTLGRAIIGGGYAICGLSCHEGPRGKSTSYLRDAGGAFLGGQTLTPFVSGAGSEFLHETLAVAATADGGHVAAGWHWPTPDFPRSFAARFDASGNRLWHLLESLTFASGSSWARAAGVVELSDGTILFAGSRYTYSLDTEAAWLLAVSPAGVPLWELLLPGVDSSAFHGLAAGAGGRALAVGSLVDASGPGGYDLWAVEIDALGDVAWQHAFGGAGTDQAFAAAPGPDGGWVVVGETDSMSAGGRDGWILALDASGWSCEIGRATSSVPVPWTSLFDQPIYSETFTALPELGASLAPAGAAGAVRRCPPLGPNGRRALVPGPRRP